MTRPGSQINETATISKHNTWRKSEYLTLPSCRHPTLLHTMYTTTKDTHRETASQTTPSLSSSAQCCGTVCPRPRCPQCESAQHWRSSAHWGETVRLQAHTDLPQPAPSRDSLLFPSPVGIQSTAQPQLQLCWTLPRPSKLHGVSHTCGMADTLCAPPAPVCLCLSHVTAGAGTEQASANSATTRAVALTP